MTLTTEEISNVFIQMVRAYIKTRPADMLKQDFKDAVVAAEQWTIDNEGSFNTALPATFKANATTTEKALLLAYVLSVKYLGG